MSESSHQVTELYKSFFQPDTYLKTYYSELDKEVEFFLANLHGFFSRADLATRSSRRVAEVGSGPTLTSIISASRWSENIVCADFLESNRAKLKHFLSVPENGDAYSSLDIWLPYIRFVASLENSQDLESVKHRMRRSVCSVVECDVFQANPLGALEMDAAESFDVVISTLCLEFAAVTPIEYRAAITNVSSLVKPGGYVILQGALGNSYYLLDDKKFPSMRLDRVTVETAVLEAGLALESWQELERCSQYEAKPADHLACFCLVARKKINRSCVTAPIETQQL